MIASDFISLNCPSCGGKLTIEKNAPIYVCEYCGRTHQLRDQNIEFYNQCPMCHRNDKVEKLSVKKYQEGFSKRNFQPPSNLNGILTFSQGRKPAEGKDINWIDTSVEIKSKYSNQTVIARISAIGTIAFLIILAILGEYGVLVPTKPVIWFLITCIIVSICIYKYVEYLEEKDLIILNKQRKAEIEEQLSLFQERFNL